MYYIYRLIFKIFAFGLSNSLDMVSERAAMGMMVDLSLNIASDKIGSFLSLTRVRGVTRSVSARRWEGGFDARPKPNHS